MARPTADHLKLTVRLLDDRIVPTTVPSMIAPPVWWTESHFIPTATAPADNGGIWVVGNTQTAGSYGWWGPYGNDWGLVKLTADNEIDPSFNGGKVKDIDAGLLDWFRAIQVQTGNDGKVYVLARNIARDAVVYSMPTPTIVSDFSGEPTTRGGTTVRRPVAGYPNQAPYAAPFTNEDVSNSILPYPQPTPIDAPEEFFAIVRFNTDGSLDRTFNNDGIALFDFGIATSERSLQLGWL